MDATRAIQDSIHVFSLVRKYVSRILGTYQLTVLPFVVIVYPLSSAGSKDCSQISSTLSF